MEVKEQCLGCDAIVEGGGVFNILVIGIVDTVTDEFGCNFLGGDLRIVILEEEGVGCLHAILYDRGHIVLDGEIVRDWPGRADKCLTPCYRVGDCRFNDANKVLGAVHAVANVV